jgi:lipopolysaccharide/colanic/teichoic acid biosynthesis glycosyltransferase
MRTNLIVINFGLCSKNETTEMEIKNDPRVTSIGRFMRKTSMDELPLVFECTLGDVSSRTTSPFMAAK